MASEGSVSRYGQPKLNPGAMASVGPAITGAHGHLRRPDKLESPFHKGATKPGTNPAAQSDPHGLGADSVQLSGR